MSARGSFRIRVARPGDAAALARLSGDLGYPSAVDEVAARLRAIARSDDDRVWVALDRVGDACGWVHAFVARRVESDPFVELGGLVVAPAFRRRGVGAVLVDRARRWAASRGVPTFRVRTRTGRRDARRFYAALGFRESKVQAVLVAPSDGA